jgi:cell division protein ZapA (FtsZ GTPase activity inhibitor)
MNEKRKNLTIFGRSYAVLTDRSQEDIERAVEFIEERYRAISSTDLPVPEEKRLVLLALDLGLSIMDERKKYEKMLDEIRALTTEVKGHL